MADKTRPTLAAFLLCKDFLTTENQVSIVGIHDSFVVETPPLPAVVPIVLATVWANGREDCIQSFQFTDGDGTVHDLGRTVMRFRNTVPNSFNGRTRLTLHFTKSGLYTIALLLDGIVVAEKLIRVTFTSDLRR